MHGLRRQTGHGRTYATYRRSGTVKRETTPSCVQWLLERCRKAQVRLSPATGSARRKPAFPGSGELWPIDLSHFPIRDLDYRQQHGSGPHGRHERGLTLVQEHENLTSTGDGRSELEKERAVLRRHNCGGQERNSDGSPWCD